MIQHLYSAVKKSCELGKVIMVCLWSGEQGSDKEGGRQGQEQAIASPWDIVSIGQGAFAIAMAGSHQVRLSSDTGHG